MIAAGVVFQRLVDMSRLLQIQKFDLLGFGSVFTIVWCDVNILEMEGAEVFGFLMTA